jgi:uncharacterized damage-inducible protein DinB
MHSPFTITRPDSSEYREWAAAEIEPIPYNDLISGLQASCEASVNAIRDIPEEKLLYRYAPGKWTIKEMWQHIIDTERVLAYRALRYARRDETILSGFDQNQYASVSGANERRWADIIGEYEAVRQATIQLFKSFREDMALYRGQAGRSAMTVRSVGYLIIGHELHHVGFIREHYL